MRSTRTEAVIHTLVLLVVLATFALTAAVSRSPFERLPRLEDEVAYLYQARIFAGGQLVIESPEPHRSYWQPFVIDRGGRRFGKYSPGWPLLLSAGVLLGQPWVVNAFLATLAVALVYRLGRTLYDPQTGLVAAILIATSPMFLLLSGSLMSHTAALFFGVLFAYVLARLERTRRTRWAVVAGVALGMLVNTRPLTAIGVALPFALAAGAAFLRSVAWHPSRGVQLNAPTGPTRRHRLPTAPARLLRKNSKPDSSPSGHPTKSGFNRTSPAQPGTSVPGDTCLLLTLIFAIATGMIFLLTPVFNYAAVGDPTANLYTLVWEYDRIGFGESYGRSGHTPEKALLNMRRDLGLWSSDLFGWQMDEGTYQSLAANTGWWLGQGVSWILLPVGLMAAWRKRWTWLLLGTFAGLVGVHLLYWIGAQVYSARYYVEALPGLALVSAAGLTWLARRTSRPLAYAIFGVVVVSSFISYTPSRLEGLWRFNSVGRDDIEALEAARDGRPVLILVIGEEGRSWRDWGTYMALTSPYLDSDVVAARVHGWPGELEAVLERFPGRQVVYLTEDNRLVPGQ